MDFIAKCSGHDCMGIKKGLSGSAEVWFGFGCL